MDLYGYGHLLLMGAGLTIKLALVSLVFGLLFGLLGAAAKTSRFWPLRMLAGAYTTFVRALPELLFVMFVYFGGAILLRYVLSFFGHKGYTDISAFWSGVTALSVMFGAYATEVFYMALKQIDKGQYEAAKSVGLSPIKTFFRIIMPQMWRVALPGLGNLFLVLLKDTALVSVVGLHDLMYFAQNGARSTQKAFDFYMAAALLYLLMTTVVMALMHVLERLANPARSHSTKFKQTQRGVL